jgi:hypothetical protein
MMARIVIYGVNDVLLHTRQAILRSTGLSCAATADIGDVVDLLDTEDPVLLIVCSSVGRELRHTVISAVDELGKPNLRKLILSKQIADDAEGNTAVLLTPASPQTFISTVRESIQ